MNINILAFLIIFAPIKVSYAYTEYMVVFDPPSAIKTAPEGKVLCEARKKVVFKKNKYVVGKMGERWYSTDVCGKHGFIHQSQVKFSNNAEGNDSSETFRSSDSIRSLTVHGLSLGMSISQVKALFKDVDKIKTYDLDYVENFNDEKLSGKILMLKNNNFSYKLNFRMKLGFEKLYSISINSNVYDYGYFPDITSDLYKFYGKPDFEFNDHITYPYNEIKIADVYSYCLGYTCHVEEKGNLVACYDFNPEKPKEGACFSAMLIKTDRSKKEQFNIEVFDFEEYNRVY